jgi:hypothetical protein
VGRLRWVVVRGVCKRGERNWRVTGHVYFRWLWVADLYVCWVALFGAPGQIALVEDEQIWVPE